MIRVVVDGKSTVESVQIGYPALIRTVKGDGPLIDDGAKFGWCGGLGLKLNLGLWGRETGPVGCSRRIGAFERATEFHAASAVHVTATSCAYGARLCSGGARSDVALLVFRGWKIDR